MEIKTDYTLEKHLASLAQADSDYKILNSVWLLNKEKLSAGLNVVSSSYPHYSMHDASHSKTIIKNIESLLGEDRIRKLGATEAFLLLMASYTHDIGMVLFYEVIAGEWGKPQFTKHMNWIVQYSSDDDLIKAAKLLLNPHSHIANSPDWALKVKDAVTLLSADYFRNKHHERSRDYISGDSTFKKLADNFYSEQLPARFLELLSQVAHGHGIDFYKAINPLPYMANGLKSDKIHPKFIACMIRMGDYLDVDDGRFNQFAMLTLENVPESSTIHEEKHASVTHLLISPESIEVTVDCQSDPVYREARYWFDGLIKEVQLLSKEWIAVSPKDLGGLPPVILNEKIQILYQGQKPKQELRNLRFSISNERIFDMLEGGALYEDTDFVFLREIIQNAMDTSNIQLWKEILDGSHDLILFKHLREQYNKQEVSYEDIKFPDDIPLSIYNLYPINLTIKWVDDIKKDSLLIQCEDRGTGISDETLIRMTNQVGESRNNDINYQSVKDNMPFWLQPTGAFGVGLQSIFLVTDNFKITSKTTGDVSAKSISFRSAKKNAYCSVNENILNSTIKRGSIVELVIAEEKFIKEAYMNLHLYMFEEKEFMPPYDYFTDTKGGKYIHSLQEYLHLNMRWIPNLSIEMFNEYFDLYPSTIKYDRVTEPKVVKEIYKIEHLRCKDELFFQVTDSNNGYIILLQLLNDVDKNAGQQYLIRNIPLSRHYIMRNNYVGETINLLSGSSDRLVNLSRSSILKLKQEEVEKIKASILFDVMPNICSMFIEEYRNKEFSINERKSIYSCYLNLLLFSFNVVERVHDIEINSDFLKEIKVSTKIISEKNNKVIDIYRFFTKEESHVLYCRSSGYTKGNIQSALKHESNPITAIVHDSCFHPFLNKLYQLTRYIEIKTVNDTHIFYILTRSNENEYLDVEINQSLYAFITSYFKEYSMFYTPNGSRMYIPSLKNYRALAVKNTAIRLDGISFSLNHKIISPFKSTIDLNNFLVEINSRSHIPELQNYIETNLIRDYISDKLIEHIIANKSTSEDIDSNKILKLYSDMLFDIYTGYLEDKKEKEITISRKTTKSTKTNRSKK